MAFLTAGPRSRSHGRFGGAALLGFALVAAGGCHLIIDGDLGVVRCDDEGAYGPPACAAGEACTAGVCAPAGAPVGARCDGDADCAGHAFCLDPSAVGEAGSPFCTTGCCAATDCGPAHHGLVCWSPAEGIGGLCWSAEALERPALGRGRSGDPCVAGEDCRSGVCAEDRCSDGCCDGSYCGDGAVCRVKQTPVSTAEGWACGAPPSAATATYCNSNDDCATARCVLLAGDLAQCLEPCCSSSQCPRVPYNGDMYRLGCASLGEGLRGCATLLPPTAVGEVGWSCGGDEDCRSGLCLDLDGASICSDLCCDDPSCGDPTAFVCRPGPLGGSWALRCVPK